MAALHESSICGDKQSSLGLGAISTPRVTWSGTVQQVPALVISGAPKTHSAEPSGKDELQVDAGDTLSEGSQLLPDTATEASGSLSEPESADLTGTGKHRRARQLSELNVEGAFNPRLGNSACTPSFKAAYDSRKQRARSQSRCERLAEKQDENSPVERQRSVLPFSGTPSCLPHYSSRSSETEPTAFQAMPKLDLAPLGGNSNAHASDAAMRIFEDCLPDSPQSSSEGSLPSCHDFAIQGLEEEMARVMSQNPAEGTRKALDLATAVLKDLEFEDDSSLLLQKDFDNLEDLDELKHASMLAMTCIMRAIEQRSKLHSFLLKAHEVTERRFAIVAKELRKALYTRNLAKGYMALSKDRQESLLQNLKEREEELQKLQGKVAELTQMGGLRGDEKMDATGRQTAARPAATASAHAVPAAALHDGHFDTSAWLQLLNSR